jgi:8-oxo-dGTP pyrophosphatase MutT (NUDIX family)
MPEDSTVGAMIGRLTRAMDKALPGAPVHGRFAPRRRDGTLPQRPPAERHAAALLLLFEKAGRPHVVLTLRASHLPHHADQVSLPGGRIEPDESAETAALREAHEEIGVPPAIVRVAGQLTPISIPVSGFSLNVVVGIALETPAFVPAIGEVAQVLEVPLDELADPERIRCMESQRDGQIYDVPYFEVGGLRVWGATAMVLCEFLALIGHDLDPWRQPRPAATGPERT